MCWADCPCPCLALYHNRKPPSHKHSPTAKFTVEGVDMLLFNDEGKISTLVQFDMQVIFG